MNAIKNYRKNNLKVSFETISGMMLFANLITMEYFESPLYTLIQYVFLLFIFLFALHRIHNVKTQDLSFILAIFMMGVLIVISSFLGNAPEYYLRASMYYAAFLVVMCLLLIENGYRNKLENILVGGKLYLSVILLLNDLLMMLLPDKFYNISGRSIGTALIGNKFSVVYAHLMLMFILVFLERKTKYRNRKIITYAIIVAVISKLCDCTTVMLASCLFVLLCFIPRNFKKILLKPAVVIFLFFLSAILLLVFEGVLTLRPIQFLITEVLHRDATLTGRMQVYPYLYMLISKRPLMGYGYGTLIVKEASTWYANAQNGLLDFIIRYGCLTAFFLVISIMISALKNAKNAIHKIDNNNWCVLVMIYVYMFMGIAEIVYSKLFLLFIILLYACSCNNKKEIQREMLTKMNR